MVELAGTALTSAVGVVRSHLEKARQAEAATAERCSEYVNAAYEAVHGLEGEYEEIVGEGRHLDLRDAAAREVLLIRIDRFVRRDNLRPLLVKALDGLREAQAALQRDADRFFHRLTPQDRRKKLRATARISELLQTLVNYVAGLAPYPDEEHVRSQGGKESAPDLYGLLELERLLKEVAILGDAGARERVREQVETMTENREAGQFLYMAKEAGGAAEQLRAAFG